MNQEKGFTIIEVMIAMLIFSIGILSVAALQITAIKGNATAKHIADAAGKSASLAESMMAMNYDDLTTAQTETDNDGLYTIKRTVTHGVEQNTKRIDVEISWESGAGGKNTITIIKPDS